MEKKRILSGMRPTGRLHLGNLVGALANWSTLQDDYQCYFMVADYHALMSEYEKPLALFDHTREVVLDYIACGLDPEKSVIFRQSDVPGHAELHLVLSCYTPLGWLERCPTYKEQMQQITERDLTNYAFLGYPCLQAADIVLYQAHFVPVGEDQLPHLELTREIVRRFNHLVGRQVFPEPQGKLTQSPRLLGLDRRKMSKSYSNQIDIADDEETVSKKIMTMITDPLRVRLKDPGHPEDCNVCQWYKVFSPAEYDTIADQCRNSKWGCTDCKKRLAAVVNELLAKPRAKRKVLAADPDAVEKILARGAEQARARASETLREVFALTGLGKKPQEAMTYRVDLDNYAGPLDLLLYLIRKEEVEIQDIPILRITEQYVAYLNVLTAMDINVAGEFLVMAATLMEIKSRMILPRPEMPAEEGEEPEEDPRLELVRQLLEYKRFKDAAQDLEALGDEQLRRYSRPAAEIVIGPEEQRYALDEMMKDVEIWDLLSAFARIMDSINIAPHDVIYDDTPIEQIAERLLVLMGERRTALFSDVIHQLFAGQETVARSHLVGAFLAILECIRRRLIAITQDEDFGDLRLFWREDGGEPVTDRQDKLAPPEARITSRRAARASDSVDRPEGRFKEDLDRDDSQATEFDELLDSIKIPDVETFKPIYSDDELLGREKPAEPESPPKSDEPAAPPPEGPEKPPEEKPA